MPELRKKVVIQTDMDIEQNSKITESYFEMLSRIWPEYFTLDPNISTLFVNLSQEVNFHIDNEEEQIYI